MTDAPPLPQGSVTFLVTDIEGSTQLWQSYREPTRQAVDRHDAILRAAVAAQGGVTFKVIGDAIQAAFPSAEAALLAIAVEAWETASTLFVTSSALRAPWRPNSRAPASRVRTGAGGDPPRGGR